MRGIGAAKRLVHVAATLCFVAVVAVFVVQAAPGLIGAEHSYVVLSNSMAPEINPGDSVIVGDVDPTAVREGDVVTYERTAGQPPVTHRVVEVVRDDGDLAFRTAGDNNEGVDPGTVPADALVGKVWFTIPLVGHVVQFANHPAGMAVLIGVPFALLGLSELWARSDPPSVRTGDTTANDRDTHPDPIFPRFENGENARGDGEVSATDADDGAISFGATELRLGALGFGTFALYAAYVAFEDPTGVSVGVAVGATIAAGFHVLALVLVALAGRSDTSGSAAEPAAETSGGGADD